MRSLSKSKILLLGLLTLLTGIGCTRKGDEDQSRIELVMPKSMSSNKLGVFATIETLTHVVINVSGEGMPSAVVFNWDSHESGTAPDTFVLDVPKGNNRLIQILAVYSSSDSTSTTSSEGGSKGAMKFYYGDVVKTLSLSQEGVVIPIASVGTGTVMSGMMSGRYLTAANAGPTGEVSIKYYPPNGRPGMIVDRSGIFNGWFSFFGLVGASLAYELKDGTKLFGGPISVDSFAPSTTIAKVAVPISLRNNCGSGTACWRPEEPSLYVYGWFGDSAFTSGKNMCVPASLSSFSKSARYSTNLTGTQTMLTGSTSTIPTVAQLFDTTTILTAYYLNGGNSSCSGGTEFVDKLTFSQSFVDGASHDQASVVFGPFVPQAMNGSRSPFTKTVSGTTHSFAGQFLPNIQPNIFNELVIFKRAINDNWEWRGDGAPCTMINQGSFGFQRVSSVPVTSDNFTFSVNVPAAEANYTSYAVCLANNGMVTPAGFIMNRYWFMNYSGGGGGGGCDFCLPQAQVIKLISYGSILYQGVYQPVLIKAETLDGKPANPSGAVLSLSLSGVTSSFYNAPNGGGATSSLMLNGPFTYTYFSISGGTPGTAVNFSGSLSGLAGATLNTSGFDGKTFQSSPGGATQLVLEPAKTNILQWECVPVLARVTDASGNTVVGSANSLSGFGFTAGAGNFYYDYDQDCTQSTITGTSILSTASAYIFKFKHNDATASPQIDITSISSPLTLVSNPFSLTPPGVAANLRIMSLSPGSYAGVCMKMAVGLFDSQMQPTSAAYQVDFVSTGGNTFSDEAYCQTGSPAATSVTMTANNTRKEFWFKANSLTPSLTASVASPALTYTNSFPGIQTSPSMLSGMVGNFPSNRYYYSASLSMNAEGGTFSTMTCNSGITMAADQSADFSTGGIQQDCNVMPAASYSNWTIMLRVKQPNTPVAGGKILRLMNSSGPSEILHLKVNGTSDGYNVETTGPTSNVANFPASPNQFHNIIISYDGTNLKIRVNGVETSYARTLNALDSYIYIGDTAATNFSGWVKNFTVFDRILTPTELTEMENYMNSRFP